MAEVNSAATPRSGSAVNPYAAPQAVVDDAPGGPAELASRGSRFAASLVDGLAIGGIGILAAVVIPAFANRTAATALIGIALGAGIIAVVSVNLRWLYLYGQTIGKRALKIRITRSDGSDAGTFLVRDIGRDTGSEIGADHVQGKVQPGCHPGATQHGAILDKDAVVQNVCSGSHSAQFLNVRMMARAFTACQQTRLTCDDTSGAYAK